VHQGRVGVCQSGGAARSYAWTDLANPKKPGAPLLETWIVSAAFFTNARSATTTLCTGMVAACKFPPSQNVSVLPEAKCSFANHSMERLRSIMEKLDSSTPVNNFTGGGHFHVATTVPSSYIPRDSYVVTVVLENDSVPSGRNVGLC
jgi:hypothetical protein